MARTQLYNVNLQPLKHSGNRLIRISNFPFQALLFYYFALVTSCDATLSLSKENVTPSNVKLRQLISLVVANECIFEQFERV